jgi:ribose transport system substrate-binding protein
MDAGSDPLLVTNVTSNGYAMAAETAVYVANRIGGAGNVVMFVFDPFPPVQVRGVIADAVFGNFPDITVLDRVTPDVSDGGIADSRAKMEAILAANPEPGSISAVWAAWDQPALGALQAIEAAGREARASSSPASTPTRRRAMQSPQAATSRRRSRRTSRPSAPTTADAVARVACRREIRRPSSTCRRC